MAGDASLEAAPIPSPPTPFATPPLAPSLPPQRVNDHFKFVILETLIVLTVFQEDMSVRIVVLFALMLFSKFFHTVAECRVEQVGLEGRVLPLPV